jgi:hypothetical protein
MAYERRKTTHKTEVRHIVIVNPECHVRRSLDESSGNRRVFTKTIPDLYGENFAALED